MATRAARTTFDAVPPEAADVLRPALPGLADEMIVAIAAEVPDYARAMEGTFAQLVRLGVEVALGRFVDMVADSKADVTRARDTYVNLGRGEFHAGRSLDALLAAYRVGARLAWRRFVDAGTAADLPPEAMYSLGEAIFAYIDEISAESADGYAEEQSAAAGESQRRRRRLVRLLAQDPPPAPEAVRTAAQAAAWPLPKRVAVLVVADSAAAATAGGSPPDASGGEPVPGEEIVDAIATRLARRLGGAALGGAAAGFACVFVPDPDAPGRRRQIVAAVGDNTPVGDDGEGPPAVISLGPTVPWPLAAASLRRAAGAYRLAAAGRIEGGVVVAEDHLATLLLLADREPRRGPGRLTARAARRARRRPARAADRDAAGVAGPARAGPGRGSRARRAPADRPLPPEAAARPLRHAPGGSGRPLRADPRPSGGLTFRLRALFM